eukprot:5606912-Amphidinium_carterae.1
MPNYEEEYNRYNPQFAGATISTSSKTQQTVALSESFKRRSRVIRNSYMFSNYSTKELDAFTKVAQMTTRQS